jgi:hypothetical protein
MSDELVPHIPGRPSTAIDPAGWTVFVGIRDQDYLITKRGWKRTLANIHPDRNGGKGKSQFVHAYTRYQRFLNDARRAYWKLGLMPPDWRGSPKPPVGMSRAGHNTIGFLEAVNQLEKNQ